MLKRSKQTVSDNQGSQPPKTVNLNVTYLHWFSQKANLMLYSQCPCISSSSKELAPQNCSLADFGFLLVLKSKRVGDVLLLLSFHLEN